MKLNIFVPLVLCVAVAVTALVFRQREDSSSGDVPASTEPVSKKELTALEELEQYMRDHPNPTEAQMDHIVSLLQKAGKDPGYFRPKQTNLLGGRKEPGLLKRDWDLAGLNEKLVKALEGKDLKQRRQALQEVAAFLADKEDFEVARRYLDTIISTRDEFTNNDLYAFANRFVADVSQKDPEGAANWTGHLPDRLKYSTHQRLLSNWTAAEPEAAEKWAGSLKDKALRANAITAMSQALKEHHPSYGVGWAKRLAANAEDGSRMSEVVVAHWGRVDFEAAFDWSKTLTNADDRRQAVVSLVRAAAPLDPDRIANWSNDHLEGKDRGLAIRESILAWIGKDPKSAALWLDRVSDKEVTDTNIDLVALAWLKKNEDEASAWLDAADLSQERKDYIHQISGN